MTFNIQSNAADQGGSLGQPDQQPTTPDQGAAGAVEGITPDKIAELLKRDEHAQRHIATLEADNKTVRENFLSLQEQVDALQAQLAAAKKVEELLSRKTLPNDNQNQQEVKPNMNTPTTTTFDPSVIDSMVTQRVQELAKQQEQEKNFRAAQETLSALFMDKADEHVKTVAQSNGLSFDNAMELARTNPVLFNNLFINNYKKPSTPTTPTMGTIATGTAPNATSNEITMEYWNKMRRENLAKFTSAAVQKQYHEWFHSQKK